jgi:hypothetical protein
MQRVCDIRHQRLNLACQLRAFSLELFSGVVRRLRDQLLKKMPRMSLRRPRCSTRIESFSERLIMCKMPKSENRAPSFVATEFRTSRFPLVTSTSVTSSQMDFRLDIASRCSCLFDLALATKARPSNCSDYCAASGRRTRYIAIYKSVKTRPPDAARRSKQPCNVSWCR